MNDHAKRLRAWYHRGDKPHGLTVEEVDAVFDAAEAAQPVADKEVRSTEKVQPMVSVREDVIRFVLGEAAFEGHWFGEKPLDKPMYWWRSSLRISMHPFFPVSAIPAMLPQLLRDIQSNAAIGEPAWSDIERRIGEVQVALASTAKREGK